MNLEKGEPLLIDDISKRLLYVDESQNSQGSNYEFKDAYLIPVLGHRTFDGHIYVSGATGSGKSYIIRKIIDNDKKKRKVILFTDLAEEDPAFKGMRYVKFNEKGEYNSNWLQQNVKGKIFIFDDVQFNKEVIEFRDKLLEKGRHHDSIVICVHHKLRDHASTKVPLNESKFIITFPITNRGQVGSFLRHNMEMDSKEVKNYLTKACEDGRYLIIHRFNPNLIITTKSVYRL